jgi:hypothetical protein
MIESLAKDDFNRAQCARDAASHPDFAVSADADALEHLVIRDLRRLIRVDRRLEGGGQGFSDRISPSIAAVKSFNCDPPIDSRAMFALKSGAERTHSRTLARFPGSLKLRQVLECVRFAPLSAAIACSIARGRVRTERRDVRARD